MQLVRQEHRMGCGAACIAMIHGVTYEQAIAMFPGVDFEKNGIGWMQADSLLGDLGYAVRRIYAKNHLWQDREEWPPPPFAKVHLCQVVTSMCHFVVMDSSGVVLDPLCDDPKTLRSYEKVNHVAGIFDVF